MNEALKTRIAKLKELAVSNKAWLRTAEDAVAENGVRMSPYPELIDIIALAEAASSRTAETTFEQWAKSLNYIPESATWDELKICWEAALSRTAPDRETRCPSCDHLVSDHRKSGCIKKYSNLCFCACGISGEKLLAESPSESAPTPKGDDERAKFATAMLGSLKLCGIEFHEELVEEGGPWEVYAEPEPRYFETLTDAVRFCAYNSFGKSFAVFRDVGE